MSDGPLAAWSGATAWIAELRCSFVDEHDIISDVSNTVVGKSQTRWEAVASGRLAGPAFSWQGDVALSASWEEEMHIDESGYGWIEKARSTTSGSGTGTGTVFLQMFLANGSGGYSLRATGLRFEVTTKSWMLIKDPVTGIPTESNDVTTGTREVSFPDVEHALPPSGKLEGSKQVHLSGAGVAVLSWSLIPASAAMSVDIRAKDGTSPPCRILSKGGTRMYKAKVHPTSGTYRWTVSSGASIVDGVDKALVTVKGVATSKLHDDVVLTLQYTKGSLSQTSQINLTVAEVEQITVRVKASAALTPSRCTPKDHVLTFNESERSPDKAFNDPTKALVLLRGDFEDVELEATVTPSGTPVWWDHWRASDDANSLGEGKPRLLVITSDRKRARLAPNETGSFFIQAFADCGTHRFDEQLPFKLVPVVLVQATMSSDDSQLHPGNPQSAAIPKGGVFSVDSGARTGFDRENSHIHMSATVILKSGGKNGRRLIEDPKIPGSRGAVFVGWVNNVRAIRHVGLYTDGHERRVKVDGVPALDTRRANPGTGGETVSPVSDDVEHGFPINLPVGQQRVEEALDSPHFDVELVHPVFSHSRLRRVHFEADFTAHLCVWTNAAERCYGVLRSYDWHVLGEWDIDHANHRTERIPLSASPPINNGVLHNPLVSPNKAHCEICAPTAVALSRWESP